eukprot:scaffold261_cov58-Cyclotella_meneghiniana.AAC.10
MKSKLRLLRDDFSFGMITDEYACLQTLVGESTETASFFELLKLMRQVLEVRTEQGCKVKLELLQSYLKFDYSMETNYFNRF